MKVTVFLFVTLAIASYSSALPTKNVEDLTKDLNEFLHLLPQEKLEKIFHEYSESDEEVKKMVKYITSEEYMKFVQEIFQLKEYQELAKYILSHVSNFEEINKSLITSFKAVSAYGKVFKTGGVKGMLQDMEDVIPFDKIIALSEEKLKAKGAYAKYYDLLISAEYTKLYCAVEANETYQKAIASAKEHGYDVELMQKLNFKIYNLPLTKC